MSEPDAAIQPDPSAAPAPVVPPPAPVPVAETPAPVAEAPMPPPIRRPRAARTEAAVQGRRFSLVQAVGAMMRERKVCVAEAAEAIGVPAAALRRLLLDDAPARPSQLPRYAAWLGCDLALLVPRPAAAKPAVRRGRPPRTVRKAPAVRRSARADPALKRLGADALAVRLHRAPRRVRRVVALVLASLSGR